METYATIPAFEVPAKFKAEIIELIKNFGKKANIEIKNLEVSNDEAYDIDKQENMEIIDKVIKKLDKPSNRAVFERLKYK